MSKEINHIYEFGDFRLETAERLLSRHGESISLPPKAFETLLALVRNSGHLITKDELMTQVWPDAFVEEVNLARNIWTVRKALGDDNGEHQYIQTVPKVGYRFVAPVTVSQSESSGLLIQRRIMARIVHEELETSDAPQSEIAVREQHLLPGMRSRHAGRWTVLGLFVLVALTAAIVLGWGRLHAKLPAKPETGLRLLSDGQHNDDAPYWGSDGEIYFLRYFSNTRYESWKMSVDGTNQRRANSEIKNLLAGRWSPDGKKVIFRREDDPSNVYLADADGAHEILLPFPIGQGDWSPDSSQYVDEVRTGKDSGQIFLIDIKTRRNTALTDNHSLNADPSFSPDGKQIVFASNRSTHANIYLMQADGSNVRRLSPPDLEGRS